MNNSEMWKILDIEPTKDENEIVNAYRTKVVTVNPEDDAEGFMKLREAFEMAIGYAREEEKKDKPEEEKTEVEKHLDKLNVLYDNLFYRKDENKWREWLDDPLCLELDTSDEVRRGFLIFVMTHWHLPHKIWELIDERFRLKDDAAILKEEFPADFIEYIIYAASHDEYMGYEYFRYRQSYIDKCKEIDESLLDIKLETDFDDFDIGDNENEEDTYIKYISQLHSRLEDVLNAQLDKEEEERERKLNILIYIMQYLETAPIYHPIETAIKMRVLLLTGRNAEALKLAEAVIDHGLFEIPNEEGDETVTSGKTVYGNATAAYVWLNVYYEHNGLIDDDEEALEKTHEFLEELLKEISNSSIGLMGKAMYYLIKGDYEKANDNTIKILDENSKNAGAMQLLKLISQEIVDVYGDKLQTGEATEDEKLDLAWAYFRMEDSDNVLRVLGAMQPGEEQIYAYNNLYGRTYHMKEQFEEARPYLEKWLQQLNELILRAEAGEELTDKEKERIKRKAFCYYMNASCLENVGEEENACDYYVEAIKEMKENIDGDMYSSEMNELLFYQENYGKLLHKMTRYEEAMEVWNEMIDSYDFCIPAYIHRQETAYETRDAQLVIDDYYIIIRDYPSYAKAYYLAAKVFYIYDQYKDVDEILERAEENGIESDLLDEIKALRYADKDEKEEARRIYEVIVSHIEAGESDVDNFEEFYSDVSSFYISIRDEDGKRIYLDKAEEYNKIGLEINPENKRLLWIKTDVEEFNNRDAIPVYDQMEELFPNDPNVYFEYGEYLKRKDNTDKALEKYLKCYELNKEHKSVSNKIMSIYSDKYDESESRRDYDEAVFYATEQLKNMDDDYYRIERALLYIEGYEIDKAEEDAKKAIEMRPDNVYAHNALGLCFLRRREYNEAIKCLEKALEVMTEPETPSPYVNISKAYEALKKYDKAIEYMLKCNEIFGENLYRKNMLSRLYSKNKQLNEALNEYIDMEKYYRKRLEETENRWYEVDIERMLIKKIENAYLNEADYLASQRLSELNQFLKNGGYMSQDLDLRTKGNERLIVSRIFRALGDHYLYTERQFKNSIKYYEMSLRFLMSEDKKGNGFSILKKNGLFSRKKDNPIEGLDCPEDYLTDIGELCDLAEEYQKFALACYSYGFKAEAKALAKRSLNCMIKGYGSEEGYVSNPKSRPFRLGVLGIDKFILDEKKEANDLIGESSLISPCDFCYYGVCYDKFLALAHIAELSGDIPKAIEYYKMARVEAMNDSEPFVALRSLAGKVED